MANNKKTGLILSYLSTILNMICGIFLSAFILRIVGDIEYGLYQSMAAFISYLVILEFGVGTVMTRNLLIARQSNDEEKIKKITATLWNISLALAVVILVVGIGFYFSIPCIYSDSITPANINYAKYIFAVMLAYLLGSFLTQTLCSLCRHLRI